MSSRQLSEWQAFWEVEPWGAYREDWRIACLLAYLANMFRSSDHAAVLPSEFLTILDPTGETEPPLSPAEQATTAFEENWQAMLGE